jgi:hypothetical protein
MEEFRMKKINRMCKSILMLVTLSVLMLSGCSYSIGSYYSESSGKIDATYATLNEKKDKSIKLNEGQTLVLDYSVTVNKGVLCLSVTNPDKETVWEVRLDKGGSDKIEIQAKKTGTYTIIMKGEETGGGCHIKISKK